MPRYNFRMIVTGENIHQVRRVMEAHFPNQVKQLEVIANRQSRADRLSEAEGWVDDAKNVVVELKDELEEWKNNLPESLQNGSKAEELDEAIQQLEEIESNLDNCSFDVSFPAMR